MPESQHIASECRITVSRMLWCGISVVRHTDAEQIRLDAGLD